VRGSDALDHRRREVAAFHGIESLVGDVVLLAEGYRLIVVVLKERNKQLLSVSSRIKLSKKILLKKKKKRREAGVFCLTLRDMSHWFTAGTVFAVSRSAAMFLLL
jgi:hypothetical protein